MKLDCTPIPSVMASYDCCKVAILTASKGKVAETKFMFDLARCLIQAAHCHVESIIANHPQTCQRR